jgi:mono/diheme cytochrome c family protein
MNKKVIYTIILALLFSIFLTLSASSAQGRNLFISKCGQCHKTGGEAGVFAPTKYASSQWERFFSRGLHKRKKDISGLFTPEELEAIERYLVNHAADSSQPEAAGLK